MEIDSDSPGVRIPPPLLFLGTLVVGLAAGGMIRQRIPVFGHGMLRDLGWFALVAGFAILFTAIGLFRKAGTGPNPSKPVTSFVTDGVYRWTRNPMYLGMASIYLGVTLIANSPTALLLLFPLIFYVQREIIEREEEVMESRFGGPYRDYKTRVRRWI